MLSMPSVRLLGVVVKVIREEPMISIVSRTAMVTAVLSPSTVTVSFQTETNSVPGVRKRLNTTVISSRKTMAFIPFTMNLKGTRERPMTVAKKIAATP